MNSTNKLNFVLLIFISLAITIGCNLSGGSKTTDAESKSSGDGDFVTVDNDSEDDDSITMDEAETESDSADKDVALAKPKSNSKQTIVKFSKGKTSRSYENAVIRGEKHTYYIGASKGQNMSVKINSLEDNANFVVISPDGGYPIAGTEENGVKSFNETLDENGKYKIIVTPTRGNTTFKINFAVSAKEKVDPPDNSGGGGITKVVKFGKGKTSARYSGAVIRAESDKYILGASGGQTMSVSISSLENNAVFDIVTPTGGSMVNESRSWSGQLPTNGKYRITVSGTRGNATYKINFAVR